MAIRTDGPGVWGVGAVRGNTKTMAGCVSHAWLAHYCFWEIATSLRALTRSDMAKAVINLLAETHSSGLCL